MSKQVLQKTNSGHDASHGVWQAEGSSRPGEFMFKRSLLLLIAGITLMSALPASAQHHRRHRHCFYRHGHRVCRWN